MRKLVPFTLFILFTLASGVMAQESFFLKDVEVVKSDDHIFIEGPKCSVLLKQVEAINHWQKKVSQKNDRPLCSCDNKLCKINITHILPRLVQEKEGTCSTLNGPNCLNASLVTSKILPYFRYTSGEEMTFWLSSPLCQERRPGERREAGDIVIIRNANAGDVHSFVYLTDELSFSKNGFKKENPYLIQSTKFIFQNYKVAKECEQIYHQPTVDQKCPLYANSFKCMPLAKYLKDHPLKDKALIETWKSLDELECKFSESLFTKLGEINPNASELNNLASNSIHTIFNQALNKLSQKDLSPDERLMWEAIFAKTLSMFKHDDQ
jgi:hypothetical protein